jgi:hypothetical protein
MQAPVSAGRQERALPTATTMATISIDRGGEEDGHADAEVHCCPPNASVPFAPSSSMNSAGSLAGDAPTASHRWTRA